MLKVSPDQQLLSLFCKGFKTPVMFYFSHIMWQDASRAGRFPSSGAESTEELLNRSHSLRYGLQVLERERGRTQLPAHTTPYPIL